MGNGLRLALSSASIFGAIVFSDFVNDNQINLLVTLVVTGIYQVALMVIGALSYFFTRTVKAEDIANVEDLEEAGFEIQEIITKDSKVIGKFGGESIFDAVKVIFKNGHEAKYVFSDTLKYENLDVNHLKPGSLVLEPGLVYVPEQ